MALVLITGASRGSSIALVRELSTCPAMQIRQVFATARRESSALSELAAASAGRVLVVQIDVETQLSSKEGRDILINNAGICQYVGDGVKLMDNLTESFTINILGVHYVTRAFLPLLQRVPSRRLRTCCSTTSLVFIALARASHDVPAPAYKISKAGLHALTAWMKTDLGGGDIADLTPEQGAKASLDILFRPNAEINGQFPKVLVPGWET
ncbi:NAD(P)-binding protein [Aspergillus uvarum CBS 121591]|uniref:NAD(P)-binding protein n=1 Tax=Aspergillus uvarum CBS 121591 TaxID=1448315 RepID=A0A319C8V3_9EURO|nr:NAD(P)-binding protein [Aspergillus uvarum CBS 121591]PYH81855.1 NAD(P)-binding protein [Aspergillus uvarum CBS 121591]